MLSECERKEIVADVAKDLGIVVSVDDPIFAAVAINERVLACSASTVARRMARELEDALRKRESKLAEEISEAVATEIRRLTEGAARGRAALQRTAKRWLMGLAAVGGVELLLVWLARGGG